MANEKRSGGWVLPLIFIAVILFWGAVCLGPTPLREFFFGAFKMLINLQ